MHASGNADAEIRGLLERWKEAFREKNSDAVMAVYARGNQVVAFDVVPPLVLTGSGTYQKSYEEFFGMFDGPIRVELKDLRIVASGEVAFLHCLDHFEGTLRSGDAFSMWLRVTSGLQKIDGEWRIVHDHVSVPTNFETGMAVVDAEP